MPDAWIPTVSAMSARPQVQFSTDLSLPLTCKPEVISGQIKPFELFVWSQLRLRWAFRAFNMPVNLLSPALMTAHGIVPTRSANHGPSTSFYYRDPDGNRVELSVKNYATEAETLAFMQSEAFRKNPAGIDVDPAEYVGKYRGGLSLEELRRIPEPA
jgi:hypothetical protein